MSFRIRRPHDASFCQSSSVPPSNADPPLYGKKRQPPHITLTRRRKNKTVNERSTRQASLHSMSSLHLFASFLLEKKKKEKKCAFAFSFIQKMTRVSPPPPPQPPFAISKHTGKKKVSLVGRRHFDPNIFHFWPKKQGAAAAAPRIESCIQKQNDVQSTPPRLMPLPLSPAYHTCNVIHWR